MSKIGSAGIKEKTEPDGTGALWANFKDFGFTLSGMDKQCDMI